MHATGPEAASARRRWWSRGALLAVLALAVLTFYALGLHRRLSWDYIRGHLDQLRALVLEHRVLAVLAFFAAYVAITALSLPVAAILSLLAGALFDQVLGTAVVSLASTLGATLAMLSARYLLRDFVQRHYGKRLEALQQGVQRDGSYYLFTLRLVPLFPFWLINLGMGLTRMPARTFAAVSWLGMLPATVVYVNAGTEIGHLDSPEKGFSPGLVMAFALLGIVPLVLRKLVQWKVRIRTIVAGLAVLLLAALGAAAVHTWLR
jgi:uncharacterized membrane protein YdjX (TVP38/TMEM64 family)